MRPPGPFRKVRQSRGLSLDQFAAWAGVSRSTVHQVEVGTYPVEGESPAIEKIVAAIRRLPKPDPALVEEVDMQTPLGVLVAEYDLDLEGAHDAIMKIECGAEGAERAALMDLLRLALDRMEQINRVRVLRAQRPA